MVRTPCGIKRSDMGDVIACHHSWWYLLGYIHPTESAAIGVLYGLFFGMFVYKELDYVHEDHFRIILVGRCRACDCGRFGHLGRILTLERSPTEIAQFILSIAYDNKLLILPCITALLLIVGTFMETPLRLSS